MGYDVTRFTDQPDGEFLCSICLGVFEDPLQGTCGHVYCSVCIKNWLIPGLPTYQMDFDASVFGQQQEAVNGVPIPDLNQGPMAANNPFPGPPRQTYPNVNPRSSCPLDKKPLSRNGLTPIPLPLKGLLNKLEIRCGFESCTHKCALSDIASHEVVCEFNPSSEITCPKCSRKMVRSERAGHDCIDVLKGIVEKLEREVDRLKKKRRFAPTPFNGSNFPNQPQPSTSSDRPYHQSSGMIAQSNFPSHGLLMQNPMPNAFANLMQPSMPSGVIPYTVNRPFRPGVMPSSSVIRRNHVHHHGHPYNSRSPHTPPRAMERMAPRSTDRRQSNSRDQHRQQFLEGLPSDSELVDLDSPPNPRSPRSQARQLRIIPSLPVAVPQSSPMAGPSNAHHSPRTPNSMNISRNGSMSSIHGPDNSGHHQIVAIGGGIPRSYSFGSDAGHDVILFDN